MPDLSTPLAIPPEVEAAHRQWMIRLDQLVNQVEGWSKELDWPTRRIEVPMQDSEVGRYMAPGLILQHETVRVMLEPIARSAPGVEGVVDLYLMPAYDDIATLCYRNGGWQFLWFPQGNVISTDFSKEVFRNATESMKSHAQND